MFSSIAIAGAYGYIGQKFLRAAVDLEIATIVYFDPGTAPPEFAPGHSRLCPDERHLYDQPVELFHLAMHPEHRQLALQRLLIENRDRPAMVLCEKPMAAPETPEMCRLIHEASNDSAATLLFDFPELYDPITERIIEFLSRFSNVVIDEIQVQRSKDREDPSIARNYKRMVTIQYQESVHCLAFVLHLLRHVHGNLSGVFADGLQVTAHAERYAPPNPNDYAHPVDGRCVFEMKLAGTRISGRTDFKRNAPWAKRRVIRGRGDKQPFAIEADYLEGGKRLVVNGQACPAPVNTNSYVEVLRRLADWRKCHSNDELISGPFPHASFARTAYQLSSVLWAASHQAQPVTVASLDELLDFDADYANIIGNS